MPSYMSVILKGYITKLMQPTTGVAQQIPSGYGFVLPVSWLVWAGFWLAQNYLSIRAKTVYYPNVPVIVGNITVGGR